VGFRPASIVVARGHPSYGTWFAAGVVLLVSALFALNNLGPYLGLPYAGAMTMFTNQAAIGNKHFILRKTTLTDAGRYVSIVQFDPGGLRTPPATQFQTFVTWTHQERRVVNLNLIRYHASRICESAPGASVRLALLTETGESLDYDNVCEEPHMLQYVVASSMSECRPNCWTYLSRWARGRVPAE
jgi:hypothetical protein